MNVPPGWALLDCDVAKSFAGAEPAAMLAQTCEKRGRKAADDRKVEAVEKIFHFREIGDQVITSFIKFQAWSSRRTGCALRTKYHRWQHATTGWE